MVCFMTTDERDAIDAVRRFLAASRQSPMDEDTVSVGREDIDGRDAWVVSATDAPKPSDGKSAHQHRNPILYLVDVHTGCLFGYLTTGRLFGRQVRLSRSMFPDDLRVPGQVDRSKPNDEASDRTIENAIDAVTRYLAGIGHHPIDRATAEVTRDVVVGRDTWVVRASDTLNPDEPAWMQTEMDSGPVPHFVDADTGTVFGYEARGRVFFDAADRARHDAELAAAAEQRAASSLGSIVRRWWVRR